MWSLQHHQIELYKLMWLKIHKKERSELKLAVLEPSMSVVYNGQLISCPDGCEGSMVSLYVRLMLQWLFAVGGPLPLIFCKVKQGQRKAQRQRKRVGKSTG